jgi:hypothetical protein
VISRRNGNPAAMTRCGLTIVEIKPIWVEGLDVWPAQEVFDRTLRDVGARPWDRDPIDQRIVQSVRHRDGHIIDSQDDVEGYPQMPMAHCALEVPETNIDIWLSSFIVSNEE